MSTKRLSDRNVDRTLSNKFGSSLTTITDRGTPTLWQVVFGTCFLVALAAVPLYWSLNEEDLGSRIFLCALGSLLLALAIWRVVAVARLSRARQR